MRREIHLRYKIFTFRRSRRFTYHFLWFTMRGELREGRGAAGALHYRRIYISPLPIHPSSLILYVRCRQHL